MYQCQYPKIAQVEYKDAKMNTNLYLYDKKTFACDTQSYLDQYSSSCYVATPRQEVDLIYFEFNTFRKYSVFEILSQRQNILNLSFHLCSICFGQFSIRPFLKAPPIPSMLRLGPNLFKEIIHFIAKTFQEKYIWCAHEGQNI